MHNFIQVSMGYVYNVMYIRFAVLSDPLKSGAPYFSFSLTLIRDFLGENAEEETPSSSERGKHSDNSLSDADPSEPLVGVCFRIITS